MTIRAIRQYPRIEAFKTLEDAEVYLRKLLVALQEEAVVVSTLYRTFIEGIKSGDEFNIIEILDELPDAGNAGRVVYLTTDGKIYTDDGEAWIVLVDSSEVYEHIGGEDDPLVDTAAIANAAIETAKIAAAAVEEAKLATDAVTAAKIKASAVTTVKLNALAVTAAKIAAGAVTTAKLYALSVTAAKIAALAIETGHLAANAVTAAKIAAGTITATEIAAGAIDTDELAANAVTAAKIAAGTITADEILAGTITADEIIIGGITTDRLSNGMAENFDALTTGAIHGQGSYVAWGTWTTTRDSDTDATINVLSGADKYLYLLDNSAVGHVETELTASSGNEIITGVIEWEMLNSANNKNSYMHTRQGAALSFGIYFSSDGNLKYQCIGGVAQTLQAYAASTWYKIRVHFDCISRYCCIFIDDVFNSRQALAAGALGNYIDGIRFYTNDADVIGLAINNLKIYNVTV